MPAAQRAERIAARIAALADDPESDVSALRIEPVGMARSIFLGNTMIVAVGATVIATILGTLLAIGLNRYFRSALLEAKVALEAEGV